MKRDPNFEVSADMRLLELSRKLSDATPPVQSRWQSRGSPEVPSIPLDEVPEKTSGALIVTILHASPATEIIPGAVITVTLSLKNDGGSSAHDIVIHTPVPGSARIRSGSLRINGREASQNDADAFFGIGHLVAELANGARTTYLWAMEVLAGTEPLFLSADVRASDGAVIAPRSLRLSRKLGAGGTFQATVSLALSKEPIETPIYELDEEEQLVHDAVIGPLEPQPIQAVVQQPQAPPIPAISSRQVILLTTAIDRASLAFFERIFNGAKAPMLLDHLIFASQLACLTQQPVEIDDAQLRKHQDGQAQLLARISLHERLKKRDALQAYAGTLTCNLSDLSAREVPNIYQPRIPASACLLALEPSDVGLATLVRLTEPHGPWDFLRARQLTHALGATTVLNGGLSPHLRSLAEQALRSYAQASANALQRLFVRQRIERSTGVLFVPDQTLDAAARQVVSVMTEVAG